MSNIRDRGPRDYRQEEQRRNELARERGFTSRAQLRNRVSKGFAAGRVTKAPAYERAGFTSQLEYRKARKVAKAWSDHHSRQERSEYKPSELRDPTRFRAYYDAYPSNQGVRNRALRKQKLRHYLVDVMGYMTGEEFDRGDY